jgi:ribosomal protein L11 methyltransferase
MEEGDQGIHAYFEDIISPDLVTARWGGTAQQEKEFDPADFERQHWDPIIVGDRFYIAPPWVSAETPPGRLRLEIDASTAFGTGRHESTQLCLQALEKHMKHGDTVLDLGCGSGILVAAAELLGAGQTIGCDISFDSLTVAQLHVRAPLFAGSAEAVCEALADVTLVNISVRVVDRLAPELKRVTKPGGLVVLAGFVRQEQPKRFRFEELLELGDWQCWICRPQDIDASGLGEAAAPGPDDEQWWK